MIQSFDDNALLRQAEQAHQVGQVDRAAAIYRQLLLRNPRDAKILFLLGATEMQKGRFAESVVLFDSSLAVSPHHPEVLCNRGIALVSLRRYAEALTDFERACALQPNYAKAHFNRGFVLQTLGRAAEALEAFDRAIASDRASPMLHGSRGLALRSLGRLEEALAAFDRAIALQPRDLVAQINKGHVLNDLGRFEAALACFDRALALKPDFIEAINGRCTVLVALGRIEEALAGYDRALRLNPRHVGVLNNRCNVYRLLNRLDAALADADRALTIDPDNAELHGTRGNVLKEMERHEEALACFDRAIALAPMLIESYNNRANVLSNLHRFEDALADNDHVLAAKPDFAMAHSTRGNILAEMGRREDALACFDRALELGGDAAQIHWNRGLVKLLVGDYAEGWKSFEYRWTGSRLRHAARVFDRPLWLGAESLAGKTVLIHAEQGLGDTLQFCRYVPMVAALGAKVVFEVQRPVLPLVATLAGEGIEIVAKGTALPPFDLHCPLMSLPLAFKTTLESIPCAASYLSTDPIRQDLVNQRLGEKSRPRIGLVWSGRAGLSPDRKRSIPLEVFAPLFALPYDFHCLQKEIRETDAKLVADIPALHTHMEELGDFADTAALIAAMDLTISVDTSVAHAAGAIGAPLWVLVPFAPDWRWLLERSDCLWYPSARILRMRRLNDWEGVIDNLCRCLADGIPR